MGAVELTESQRRIVTTLVNEYQLSDSAVKATQIAERIGRKPGSVRNQMQSLKSLNAVEGIPGPQGGYKPTETAYTILDRDDLDNFTTVPLSGDYQSVDVVVDEIDFTNVNHPDECKAHIHFHQSVPEVDIRDPILVGPTPSSHLVVGGQVEAINDTGDTMFIAVTVVEAPFTASE